MPPAKPKNKKTQEEKDSVGFAVFLPVSLLIVCAAAFAVTYLSLAKEIYPLYKSLVSRGWSQTDGAVVKTFTSIKSKSLKTSTGAGSMKVFVPNVVYAYRVDEKEYEGSRRRFTGEEEYFRSREESEAFLADYRGKTVTVYYDAGDPSDSTLSREYVYEFGDYQAGCCCGSLGVLFGLLFWLSIKDLIKIFRKRKK